MDEVFRALADASRRKLLDRLNARNGQSLRELSEGLEMSRQAVTKHLSVLEAAGLVTVVRHGREKLHYLNPVPIHDVADRWIGRYERGRLTVLSRLKHSLEGAEAGTAADTEAGTEEGSAMTATGRPQFVYSIYIRTTPEKLYQALTDPEFIKVYMGGTGPSRPGSRARPSAGSRTRTGSSRSWASACWRPSPAGGCRTRGTPSSRGTRRCSA